MTRRSLYITAALLALVGGGVAWWAASKSAPALTPAADTIAWQAGPPTSISRDAEEIFAKAMWRRPGPDDKILHAERHEWSDAEGVNRWQWFLIVEASPALITYLREDNAFGLVPGSVEPNREAPAWFAFNPAEVSVLKSPLGRMQLMFAKNSPTLYATSNGLGFTKGASLIEKDSIKPGSTAPSTAGRLPNAPPPHPKPQHP